MRALVWFGFSDLFPDIPYISELKGGGGKEVCPCLIGLKPPQRFIEFLFQMKQLSCVEEEGGKRVNMAHLAIIGRKFYFKNYKCCSRIKNYTGLWIIRVRNFCIKLV